MKKINLFMASVFVTSASFAQTPEIIEANITHVFIPKKGYDTNDDVHFVAEGVLPNSCYSLIKSTAPLKKLKGEDGTEKRVFDFHQLAQKETTGKCSESELKKPENEYLKYPRPITALEIYLPEVNTEKENGSIYSGEYAIQYYSNSIVQKRTFFVDEPLLPKKKDNFDYAPVLDVTVPLKIQKGNPLAVEIGVWLSNSCQVFEDSDIKYEVQDDIILVRPIIRGVKPGDGVFCLQVMKFETATLTVKESLDAGRYLVHTRSRDGKGWNNPFSVTY